MLMLLNNNYRLRYLLLELFNAFFFFFWDSSVTVMEKVSPKPCHASFQSTCIMVEGIGALCI